MKQSSSQLVAIRNLNLTGQSHFERSSLVVRVSHEFGPQLASHLTPDGIWESEMVAVSFLMESPTLHVGHYDRRQSAGDSLDEVDDDNDSDSDAG